MTCDPRLLSYYRDGALSFEERYELEDHLRECAECAAEMRGLMKLAQVVRSLPMVPVSPTLRDDVYRALAEQEERRRQPISLAGVGRALAPAVLAASIAVSALVAFRPGALDLASQPAPASVSVSVQGPNGQTAPAQVSSSAGSAVASANLPKTSPDVTTANLPKPASDPVAPPPPARPARIVPEPVADANGGLPVRAVDPSAVPAPIARLYGANQQIRDMLGEASPGSRTVTLLEQSFQGGLAILRGDTRQIYVLRRDGSKWSVHSEAQKSAVQSVTDGAPPAGAMLPAGGFASVWRSSPEIKSRLGWAVYEPRGSGGSIQMFERGLVVWTPHGILYVLTNDGHWRTFPDASPI